MRLKTKISKEQESLINDAWLGIHVDESKIANILHVPEMFADNPSLWFTYIMSRPDYLFFICHHILGFTPHPFQLAILQEMWNRKFPMFIGSRGLGKSSLIAVYCFLRMILMPGRKIIVAGAAFRQSKLIFEYMHTIWNNSPILRDMYRGHENGPKQAVDECKFVLGKSTLKAIPIGDGCLSAYTLTTYDDSISYINRYSGEKSQVVAGQIWSSADKNFVKFDEAYNNGSRPTKKISTKHGFEFEGTHNHKFKVFNEDLSISWKRFDEMVVGDNLLIDISERWYNPSFQCTTEQAYALGLMLGDGCYTDEYNLRFATKDDEFINSLNLVFNKPFVQSATDTVHWNLHSKPIRQEWLDFWNITDLYTKDKVLPPNLLKANQECVAACISGLFDTDGHIQSSTTKGGQSFSIGFTNTSKLLVYQIQYILLHFGIISTIAFRDRVGTRYKNRIYELYIHGADAVKFVDKIGFKLTRKKEKCLEVISSKSRFVSYQDIIPNIKPYMLEIAKNTVSNDNAFSYSKINSRKNITRAILKRFLSAYSITDGHLYELAYSNIYFETIVNIEDGYCDTYDLHVPETHEYCAGGAFSHNSKIRGLRANDLLVDEFSSINREIFETVLAGFGAVSAQPLKNVQELAAQKMATKLGIEFELESESEKSIKSNQLIISGTASYDFEHFAEYWKRWREIITSRGDLAKLARYEIDSKDFNYKDYSIIRIPYELIPEGFMDAGTVARAKATNHISTYMKEYGAVFAKDSLGFFKRSLIEACTVKETIDYHQMPEDLTVFSAFMNGDPNKKYVMGVDPASDVDNFSIIILEINKLHRKIVYCWTTNKKDHMERIKHNLTQENNYYAFCARKIRNLMKRFNIVAIAIDSQGGGKQIVDSLNDKERIEGDESYLWPIIEEDKEKPTDAFAGKHIVHLINFSNAEWTADANHGMKKDFEDKALIFPFFDSIILASIQTQTADGEKIYDTLEDCYFELQELKDELSIIVHSKTPSNNRDRWDTPETKMPNGKKGRMRKDRYSALLMANAVGRTIEIRDFERRVQYQPIGGFATGLILPEDCKGNPLQQKPDWFNDDYYNYL